MKSHSALAHRNPILTRNLNEKDFLATQISYKLNLKGPAMSVQSACSSSLLAVHLACQSLLSNECDMALAGGAQIDALGSLGYIYTEGSILSPDGHCRAFDKDARGTLPGNGMGVVLLKKLANAVDDGDHIYAVIKGSAANNDGANKMAYTAPSVEGQRDVILEALSVGDVTPDTIGLLEAHGTGTPLGDPVEVAALKEAFGQYTERKNYCALGSVKTNIGHLDCAAGIASFIKAVLSVNHGQIVPTLNYRQANPALELDESPFYVSQKNEAWASGEHPRRAGISSLGVGGTNVHVVIEQFEPANEARPEKGLYFIPLSAKTPKSLSGLKAQLIDQLKSDPTLELADVEHTLLHGRHHFENKFSAVCSSKEELINQLSSTQVNQVIEGKFEQDQYSIVFMYPGQGSQYANMALELYNQNETFRKHLELCFSTADQYLTYPLESYLFGDKQVQLSQTHISQIAVFSVEYSLTKLWEFWGIIPHAVVGHSLGEFAAACASGVLSLEDAVMLICARGKLMGELPPGDMISVALPATDIEKLLCEGVVIAGLNGPQQTVLSGNNTSVNAQKQVLLSNGVTFRELKTSHAFHSHMMEAMLEPFREKLESVEFNEPTVPFVSTLTGRRVDSDELCTPQYWLDQIIQPVQFEKAIKSLSADHHHCLFIEVGSGNTLSSLVKSVLGDPRVTFSCLPKTAESDKELRDLCYLRSLIWHHNVAIKRPDPTQLSNTRMISLPGTVFDTQSYWIDLSEAPGNATTSSYSKTDHDTLTPNEKCIASSKLSLLLDVSILDDCSISESQSKALDEIQQKLVNDVKSLFQEDCVHVVSSIQDKVTQNTGLQIAEELDSDNNSTSFLMGRLTTTEYVPPTSEVETFLTTLWQTTLGYQPVGINDNYFAVGGDSLTATTMIKVINKEFELTLSFRDLSENQNISELAKVIDLRKWITGPPASDAPEEYTERFEL